MDPYATGVLEAGDAATRPVPLIRIFLALATKKPCLKVTRHSPSSSYGAIVYDIWCAGPSHEVLNPIQHLGLLRASYRWQQLYTAKTSTERDLRRSMNPGAADASGHCSYWADRDSAEWLIHLSPVQCLRFIQAWIVVTHMQLLKSCFDSKVYRSLERRSWTDASEGYAATCHGLVVHQYASVLIPPKRVEISMKPTPLCWSWGNSPPQFQFISRQFISHTCAEMSSYYFELINWWQSYTPSFAMNCP